MPPRLFQKLNCKINVESYLNYTAKAHQGIRIGLVNQKSHQSFLEKKIDGFKEIYKL
jgi:hypothetical protein